MAILSNRTLNEVSRTYHREYGLRPTVMDLSGEVADGRDGLASIPPVQRKRDYALQESLNLGTPYVFSLLPGVVSWMVCLEDRRMIHGGLIGGAVATEESDATPEDGVRFLADHGMAAAAARRFLGALPRWPDARVREASSFLQETFYQVSGWQPELMRENRLRALQKEQLNQAISDQRKRGVEALYAFEKERVLLANIRAGDRNGARRILNEMLGTIYLSSPQLAVLRARTIELMSCLTRAAIEDNPLMEPLIERNHAWTETLIKASSFEEVSKSLMEALDDFIDGIYLHGANRSNTKVRQALDFISRHFKERISLSDVARDVGLSPCRLSHLVKEFTGRTVLQVIHEVRINHARQRLDRTAESCAEIAYACGYSDQSYFTKQFRKVTGTTPAQYRRTRRRA